MTGAGGVSALAHGECAELLALSALHALDPDEELAVQGHIGTCPACRKEFADYLEVVAHLALIAHPRTGKPHLVFDSLDHPGQEGESSAAENHTGPDLPQRTWV
jgi:hypothetical protein